MSRKRMIVAVLLLPLTLPFAAIHEIVEWWHFGPSTWVLRKCRHAAWWRDEFFLALDDEAGQGKETKS